MASDCARPSLRWRTRRSTLPWLEFCVNKPHLHLNITLNGDTEPEQPRNRPAEGELKRLWPVWMDPCEQIQIGVVLVQNLSRQEEVFMPLVSRCHQAHRPSSRNAASHKESVPSVKVTARSSSLRKALVLQRFRNGVSDQGPSSVQANRDWTTNCSVFKPDRNHSAHAKSDTQTADDHHRRVSGGPHRHTGGHL